VPASPACVATCRVATCRRRQCGQRGLVCSKANPVVHIRGSKLCRFVNLFRFPGPPRLADWLVGLSADPPIGRSADRPIDLLGNHVPIYRLGHVAPCAPVCPRTPPCPTSQPSSLAAPQLISHPPKFQKSAVAQNHMILRSQNAASFTFLSVWGGGAPS